MISLVFWRGWWVLTLFVLYRVTANDEGTLTAADQERLCPEIVDENGKWSGSRHVGGNYTLQCAPGFEVVGKTRDASWSQSMVCPSSLNWPADLVCVDIDDCAKLKHGCGAMGVCLDLIHGYDCNCERGYFKQRTPGPDSEIVCGTSNIKDELCHGHTCSAYGVCVDLLGNSTEFESDTPHVDDDSRDGSARVPQNLTNPAYRCECTEGFYDDGVTCQRYDCGEKHDALGHWTGSTYFGSFYTLQCPDGTFIWGGQLQVITISCGANGEWLSNPTCVSPATEERERQMATLEYWTSVGAVLLCVTSAALAAGLTLGLATLEPFGLKVTLAARPEDCSSSDEREKLLSEQAYARRILPVLGDHHLLLVTLLLFNTVANEALPVFLSKLVPPLVALFLSVSVVLFCGEILPSAFFTGGNQLAIASVFVPFVKFLQLCFWFAAKPIAILLDRMITESAPAHGQAKYSRAELRAMLSLHGPQEHAHAEEEGSGSVSLNCCGGPAETEMVPTKSEPEQNSTGVVPTVGADLRDHDESSDTVLSKSELQLINGVLHSVKRTLSDSRCYTPLRACFVASAQDLAADIVVRLALADGHRSVLVLQGGSTASVRSKTTGEPQASDEEIEPSSPTSPKLNVIASSVMGCLRVRDLLRNGPQSLNLLCTEPMVRLPNDATLSEALSKMKNEGATLALVVRNPAADGSQVVVGVVHMSDVLGQLISPHDDVARPRSESNDIITPNLRAPPGFPKLGNRLKRAATGEMSDSLSVLASHRDAADAASSGAYIPLRLEHSIP